MRILLIEDSVAYQEAFALLLGDAKVQHSCLDFARTADDGAQMIAAGNHDIYFVDYRLPGGDGLSLVRNARKAGIVKPIIVLTAFGTAFIDQAAEDAGATDYLPKGDFTPQTLNRTIRYALRNTAALGQAREAERRFRMAQDVAGIGTWDWDIRSNTKFWSAQMHRLYGLDPAMEHEPVDYDTWHGAVYPQDRERAVSALFKAVGGEAPYDVRFRILRPDRDHPDEPPVVRWISGRGEVFRDSTGAPFRMIGLNIDVTEQQQALIGLAESRQDALAGLRASEARFRTYFDSAVDAMFHVRRTAEGRFIYDAINPAGLDHAGASLDAVIGRTPVEVLGAEVGGVMERKLQKVYGTGLALRHELTFELPAGPVTCDAVYMPLRDDRGQIVGVLGSARDITEQRRLESSLVQAQKMEAVGQLAGGVAHDFNNLLTGMQGCFELLGRHVTTELGQRLVTQGLRAVQRSSALTSRLLAFSRQQPLTTERVDLNVSLDEMTEMLVRTLGSDMRIGLRSGADLWPALTDRNQIELAILNLAINARDAMPLGGSLTIETRNESLAEARDGIGAGDYVVLSVTDTGSGMPPEVLKRVLEPFFTTKPSGKGTGLGLSMVAGVARQLGGGLTIASEVGQGTCVSLYLPRAGDEPVGDVKDMSHRGVRVMLVDDDPLIQAIVPEHAAEAGHIVTLVKSTAEAMARLDAGEETDILVVDYSMPGLSYLELATRVRVRRPELPVLVISGKANTSVALEFPLLAKPFRHEDFNRAIAHAVGDAERPGNVLPFRRDAARSG